MIPEKVINLAVAGGWGAGKTDAPLELVPVFLREHPERGYQVTCDSTFWQALGKALGWEESPIYFRADSSEKYTQAGINAHRFYDLILTGGDTEKFWNDLLADK